MVKERKKEEQEEGFMRDTCQFISYKGKSCYYWCRTSSYSQNRTEMQYLPQRMYSLAVAQEKMNKYKTIAWTQENTVHSEIVSEIIVHYFLHHNKVKRICRPCATKVRRHILKAGMQKNWNTYPGCAPDLLISPEWVSSQQCASLCFLSSLFYLNLLLKVSSNIFSHMCMWVWWVF